MKLRAPSQEEPEINLISMVDIILVLLIFFMLTTSFVHESKLKIRLPEAGAERTVGAADNGLEVAVTAKDAFFVNGRALVDNRPETLAAAIRAVAGGKSDVPVTISADANARHQAVVTAMDVLGRTGFTDVRIATVHSDQRSN